MEPALAPDVVMFMMAKPQSQNNSPMACRKTIMPWKHLEYMLHDSISHHLRLAVMWGICHNDDILRSDALSIGIGLCNTQIAPRNAEANRCCGLQVSSRNKPDHNQQSYCMCLC
jgi:hypothetical protein